MTYLEAKARRVVVERDGVSVVFGQVPFGNNEQAVTLLGPDGLEAAHERLVAEEQRNGVVYE